MAVRNCVVFFGDSNMSGLADMDEVPSLDFGRWTGESWSTQTWPAGGDFSDYPKDVSIPDVQVLTVNVPHELADERNITATPADNQVTCDGADFVAADQDSWVFIGENTTGYGQVLRINANPASGVVLTLLDPIGPAGFPTLAIANDGECHILTKSHTVLSSAHVTGEDQTVITKTSLTADFTVVADDWVAVINAGIGTYAGIDTHRRVVSATAETVTITPRLTVLPASGDGIREATAANTVRRMSDLSTSDNFAFRAVRFLGAPSPTFNGPGDYSTSQSIPYKAPKYVNGQQNVNGVPECTWAMKSHFDGPLYVVMEGVGGATAVSNIEENSGSDSLIGYGLDIDYKDFRPGVTNGLYNVLTARLDAAKAITVAANDTLNVVGILSNVGTNDAAFEQDALHYEDAMGTIIDALRSYIVDNGMTTLAATRIPTGLTSVNASLAQRPYKETCNTSMQNIVAAKENVFYIDATDFTLEADDLHLDAPGQIAWGKAFYAGWAALWDDHTTLIVETGTGSATANSYCSVSDADAFHRERNGNPAAWYGATIGVKQDALRQATLAMDVRYGSKWAGTMSTSTQALDWPRSFVPHRAGSYYDTTTIPTRLVEATALLALLHVNGEDIAPDTETSAGISSETHSVGPISSSHTYLGGKPSQTQFPRVDKLLSSVGLVTWGGAGWGVASL